MTSRMQRTLAFLALTLTAGVMFKIPYLKTVFYDAMITDLSVTNAQLGALTGTYSIVKVLIYIPCGILVDKFNNRIMLTVSTFLMAGLTLWYGFLPSYGTLQVIHVLFAFSNAVYWVAFIKAIRMLGSQDQQGSLFGLSEGLRALSGAGITFLGLWFLSIFGDGASGIYSVLYSYAGCYFLLTMAIWIFTPKDAAEGPTKTATLKDYIQVLKVPGVWLVALLVALAYSAQIVSEYTTPYLTNVFGMTVVTAGIIGTVRSYMTGVLSAPVFGKLADKTGSQSRMVMFLLLAETLMAVAFFIVPGTPGLLFVVVTMVIVWSVLMYGVRGIYYSTMGEAGVPVGMTGTAAGIISVIGYLPDTFLHTTIGTILDKNPGAPGFKIAFILMACFAIAAAVVALLIFRMGRRRLAAAEAAAAA